MKKLNLIKTDLLDDYLAQSHRIKTLFEDLKDAEISTESFNFYTSISAIASSKIEGEIMEIDSYIKHKMLDITYSSHLTQKPNDLYNAYIFAQKNNLTAKNFLSAHKIITKNLLQTTKQGKYRQVNMLVMEHKTYRIQYEAALVEMVKPLMKSFWKDVNVLLKEELSIEKVFYFASFLHLVFVNIHPFEDGNGRSGRLLEKWFLAQKLGKKAWFFGSELHYYQNINDYYRNLNSIGISYDELDYKKALPFLLMNIQALESKI